MSEWQTIETAPRDGTTVLLYTTCHGACEAWFSKGEWSQETPINPREYSGSAWVCCDDAFQIEVEEYGPNGRRYYDGTATHWMPLPAPPKDTAQ